MNGERFASFFSDVYPRIRVPFVLVSGASIRKSPPDYARHLIAGRWESEETVRAGHRIIHWFGQNGDPDAHGDAETLRFTRIPLGLNCAEMSQHMLNVQEKIGRRVQPLDSILPRDDPLAMFPLRLHSDTYHHWTNSW